MKIKKRGAWYHLDARVDGKRMRIKLNTQDRETARARARLKMAEIGERGEQSGPVLLKDFIPQFIEYSKSRGEKSTRNKESVLRRLQAELPLVKHLQDITPVVADRFMMRLLEGREIALKNGTEKHVGISTRGVNYYMRTLKGIFSRAVVWKMISENPFAGVKKVSEETIEPHSMTKDELKKILDSMRTHTPEYIPLVMFYLLTGLRRSEALKLEWKDVDTDRHTIRVRNGKGNKSRTVPIPPGAEKILEGRRSHGKPFDFKPFTISQAFRRAARRAGVPEGKLHDLRKTYGTILAEMGVGELVIQRWLGHVPLTSVTRDHYIGMPESAGEIIAELEERVTGKKKSRKRGHNVVTKKKRAL